MHMTCLHVFIRQGTWMQKALVTHSYVTHTQGKLFGKNMNNLNLVWFLNLSPKNVVECDDKSYGNSLLTNLHGYLK